MTMRLMYDPHQNHHRGMSPTTQFPHTHTSYPLIAAGIGLGLCWGDWPSSTPLHSGLPPLTPSSPEPEPPHHKINNIIYNDPNNKTEPQFKNIAPIVTKATTQFPPVTRNSIN